MAVTIHNSEHSFIRFGDAATPPDCIWGNIDYCLPVYAQGDIAFQFVISGSEAEIAALCNPYTSGAEVSLVSECDGTPIVTFTEQPDRFVLSDTQVLFNWSHGFPGFTGLIADKECFKVQVEVAGVKFCSNCFERIIEDCFTAVVEYGNEDDAFGFKYCAGGNVDTGNECLPTIVPFFNIATLSIPYTTSLADKYGEVPTVQAWIDDGAGNLTNTGISILFDTYPPTAISFDFGGVSSGIIVIR